jgi:thiol-disulfide isomerase/thioredoxin
MMRNSRSVLAALLLLSGLRVSSQQPALPQKPALKIEPSCLWVIPDQDGASKEVSAIYFPANPAAKITEPRKLVLEVGVNGRFWRDNTRSAPFIRKDDGSWQATLPRRDEKDAWFYLIFAVKDEATAQVDDNGGQYWDAVSCSANGSLNQAGMQALAASYTGYLFDNGIGRQKDYGKAVAALEDFVKTAGAPGYQALEDYWNYKVKLYGNDDAAWKKVADEVTRFVGDHRIDEYALIGAFNFVQPNERHLPSELYPRLMHDIAALDPEEAAKLDQMALRNRARREKDDRKRAEELAAFARKYPHDRFAPDAYADRFATLRELHDVPAAEAVYPRLIEIDPSWADTYATMAVIYIENKQKPEEALKLLDKAEQLGAPDFRASPAFHRVSVLSSDSSRNQGTLAYWRAQAYLQQAKPDLALPQAQKAAEQRKSSDAYYVLGQSYEAMGQNQKAADAYLEAISRPSGRQVEQEERLEKLWVSGGFGTREQLQQKLQAQLDEAFKKANYVPRLVDRLLPEYEFTTLKGEKFRSADLKDKTVVLNFWGVWCAPCLPELPGFQVLQQKHPELIVATLTISSEPEELTKLVKEEKLDTLRIAAGDSLQEAFVPNGAVPITYVIDHGRIRVVHQEPLSNVVAYIEADLTALQEASATSPGTTAAR